MGCSPPPFSLKIFTENRKKIQKIFSVASLSKQEKKSRPKSDYSNLVKSRIPDLRGVPSINLVRCTIYCLQRLLHVMHKAQLAEGTSHGHDSLPTHPSRRPLLHRFPIMGFQSCRNTTDGHNTTSRHLFSRTLTVYPPSPSLLQNTILGIIRLRLHRNFRVLR